MAYGLLIVASRWIFELGYQEQVTNSTAGSVAERANVPYIGPGPEPELTARRAKNATRSAAANPTCMQGLLTIYAGPATRTPAGRSCRSIGSEPLTQ
jgi:hypothetical protein